MQAPENEVMDQTDLAGSLLHKQTTGPTTMTSKVNIILVNYENVLFRKDFTVSKKNLCLLVSICFYFWQQNCIHLLPLFNVIENSKFGYVVSSFT
jgi:hypothetical protein